MKYQIFTHVFHENRTRRFFVSRTERDLYRKIESEISNIISRRISDGSYKTLPLSKLYEYVENRWYSLNPVKFKDFVYKYRLTAHMKDYCDIRWSQAFGKLYHYPERMVEFSEPMWFNKEKTK